MVNVVCPTNVFENDNTSSVMFNRQHSALVMLAFFLTKSHYSTI